jgi:hypothetical protein
MLILTHLFVPSPQLDGLGDEGPAVVTRGVAGAVDVVTANVAASARRLLALSRRLVTTGC